MTSLLWLRRDLRRTDHPAFAAAAAAGPVAPVYVLDPTLWDRAGAAPRAWLAASLRAAREAFDGALTIRYGKPVDVIPELAAEFGASAVHVTAESTPYGRRRDRTVAQALQDKGIDWVATGSHYAVTHGTVRTAAGTGYAVFTPFQRAWLAHGWPGPGVEPKGVRLLAADDHDHPLDSVLQVGFPRAGTAAALQRWQEFLDTALENYPEDRDRPDLFGTSGLSPYLKHGAIHPRQLLADLGTRTDVAAQRFRTELAWREFYADVLWHDPRSAWQDLRPALQAMDYDEAGPLVEAWRSGHTGFPLVDAGMRQLVATGWMHNRVRMVTASFLTKDLHVRWQVGARHFLDQLIDGDLASNNHGWQWVAGTGTDAAPYFRVFNPVTQGRTYDPAGEYVRRWIPELAHLPGAAAHEPWQHPAGYREGYPRPIVDHAEERREALRRYAQARG